MTHSTAAVGPATAGAAPRSVGNVADWPAFYGRYAGHRPAIRYAGEIISWADLDDRVRRVSGALRRAGVTRGDRVGVLLRNHPAFLETVFATVRIGAIAAPINIRMAAPEVRDCVERGRIGTLVSERHFTEVLAGLDGVVDEDRMYLVDGDGGVGRRYAELAEGPGESGAPERMLSGDPAVLMYTSGTSGHPKGALLTHANLQSVAAGARAFDGTGPDDHLLLPVPLAFTGPLVAASMPVLAAGGAVGLERQVDLDAMVHDLASGWPTMLQMVPVVYETLSRRADFEELAFDHVRVAKTGGAPIGAGVLSAFRDRGLTIMGSYGLTEASGLSLQVPREEAISLVGAAGVPMLGHDVIIADADDRPVVPGEEGELLIRGGSVMAGYDGNSEATSRALRGGWLHTGDVGRASEDGVITIVDRRTDLIVSGGLNVYPAEIERALADHPKIREVAVVGRADSRWGHVPVACVVPRDEPVSLAEVQQYLEQRIADYKRPRELRSLDELPRGMSGKVLKEQLRRSVEGAEVSESGAAANAR